MLGLGFMGMLPFRVLDFWVGSWVYNRMWSSRFRVLESRV